VDSITKKIKKIHQLSERGIDGEAKAAKALLEKMLSKYGLTMDDLNQTELKQKWFRFRNPYERQLILQCASKVKDDPNLNIQTSINHPDKVFISMNEWQYKEMLSLLKEHKEALNKKMEALFDAYLNKHDLFANSGEYDTPENLNEIIKAYQNI
jgi:hypothetical protein